MFNEKEARLLTTKLLPSSAAEKTMSLILFYHLPNWGNESLDLPAPRSILLAPENRAIIFVEQYINNLMAHHWSGLT